MSSTKLVEKVYGPLKHIGWRKLLVRTRGDVLKLVCLLGAVPAIVTATLPTSTWIMGALDFSLVAMELHLVHRVAAILLLAIAGWLAWGLPRRTVHSWYLLPLLLFAFVWRAELGAELNYHIGETTPKYKHTNRLLPELIHPKEARELDEEWDELLRPLPPLIPLHTNTDEVSLPKAAPPPDQAVAARLVLRLDRLNPFRRRPPPPPAAPVPISPQAAQVETQSPSKQVAEQFAAFRLDEKRSLYVDLFYAWSACLLLLHFVCRYGLANWPFMMFALTSVVASVLVMRPAWASNGVEHTLAAAYPVVVGLVSLGLVRVIARTCIDSQGYFAGQPRRTVVSVLGRTLLGWLLFPLAIALLYGGGRFLVRAAEAALYCDAKLSNSIVHFVGDIKSCDEQGIFAVRNSDPTSDTIRQDLQTTAAVAIEFFGQELKKGRRGLDTMKTDGAGAVKEVTIRFNAAVPGHVFDFPGYHLEPTELGGLLPVSHALRNLVKKKILDPPYRKARAEILQAILNSAAAIDDSVRTGASGAATIVDKYGGNIEATLIPAARRQVDFWLIVGAIFAFVGTGISFFGAIRGYCYLLGRRGKRLSPSQASVAHAPAPSSPPHTAATIAAVRIATKQAKTKRVVTEFRTILHPAVVRDRLGATEASNLIQPTSDPDRGVLLEFETTDTLLANRHIEFEDSAQQTSTWIMAKLHWIFGRLRNRNYWLKTINPDREVFIVQTQAEMHKGHWLHPYAWKLTEHSEVSFRWENFVAASSTVKFRRAYSFRIPMCVLLRFRLATARGPGYLILRAPGPLSFNGKRSVSPDRCSSWPTSARFRFVSASGLFHSYVDGPMLERHPDDAAVYEAPTKTNSRNVGAFRLLVRLFRW